MLSYAFYEVRKIPSCERKRRAIRDVSGLRRNKTFKQFNTLSMFVLVISEYDFYACNFFEARPAEIWQAGHLQISQKVLLREIRVGQDLVLQHEDAKHCLVVRDEGKVHAELRLSFCFRCFVSATARKW